MDNRKRTGADRGALDLLADPGRRDLQVDGENRDLLKDPGAQDLLRDPGLLDSLGLGALTLERARSSETREDVASDRSGAYVVVQKRERAVRQRSADQPRGRFEPW